MIFLDETGKRWRRIKVGAGFISTGAIIPVAVLLAASALYLPSWGNLSLPQPLKKPTAVNKPPASQQNVLSAETPSNTQAQQSSRASAATQTQATTPAVTTQHTTSTPAPSQQGQSNAVQPTQDTTTTDTASGNKDYGQSHKPTRS